MKYKVVIIILMLLTLPVILQATNIEVSQPITLNLTGGDTQSINLTVTYTGSNKATCTMSYSVLPDGEGMNITYTPSNFTLKQNSAQKVLMIINTSLALMPNTYTIITQVSAVYVKRESGGKINIITESEDVPPDDYTPEDEPPEDIGDIVIDDITHGDLYSDDSDASSWDYLLLINIVVFIIFLITLLYIYIRRRK